MVICQCWINCLWINWINHNNTISKYIEVAPENFDVQITRSDIHIKYTGEKH